MGWSKGKFVDEAFASFGLSRLNYTLTDEQRSDSVAYLEIMVARWETQKSIHLGYAYEDTPNADTDSNVPRHATEAVMLNLALYCANGIGKTLTGLRAKIAYDDLLDWAVRTNTPQMQMRRDMPRGKGNKPQRSGAGGQYYNPVQRLEDGAGSTISDGQGGDITLSGPTSNINQA